MNVNLILLLSMMFVVLVGDRATANEVQDLIKRHGKIPGAKYQQLVEQRFGPARTKAKMLAPSLVKRPTVKPLPAVMFREIESGINNIGEAPEGFAQTFFWDRKDEQILLLVYINVADFLGVQIQNLAKDDQVIIGDASGISSFTEDTGNPLAAGIVGLLAAGAEVVTTSLGAPELIPVIKQANQFAQSQFKPSNVRHKKRDAYGVDPGSGHKAKQEGGIIVYLPGAGGLAYSGEPKSRWVKEPGDRTDANIPAQARGCFFPIKANLTHNARKVPVDDPVLPSLTLAAWDWKYEDNAGFYRVLVKIEKVGSRQTDTSVPGPR